jgi:xanthine/uracil permease
MKLNLTSIEEMRMDQLSNIHDSESRREEKGGMVLAAIMGLFGTAGLIAIVAGTLWHFGAFRWFMDNWPPFVAVAFMLGMGWSLVYRR